MRRSSVGVLIAIGLLTAACGTGGDTAVVGSDVAPAASVALQPQAAVATEPASQPLSKETLDEMNISGTTIDSADPASTEGAVTAEAAAAAAASKFRFTTGKQPTEMGFGRVTNSVYGKQVDEEADTPPGEQPAKELLIKDRLMWLVVFNGVDVPIHRPAPKKGQEPSVDQPATYQTKFLVFVDGTTGEYVRATTLSKNAASTENTTDGGKEG